jgi:phosphomannomutase
VGHSFIKEVMAETGAVFGGEHSGHYYFRDNYRADSGIIAAMVVLEVLSRAKEPLSELLSPYRRYADSGEINTKVSHPAASAAAVAGHYAALGAEIDTTDGFTVDEGDWWFNLRTSNTEPLLRLNVEATTAADCQRHVAEILGLVDELSEA